ncbi:MAG: zinc-ribbon domain-containing protein, partial [Myxococcales bacterium]
MLLAEVQHRDGRGHLVRVAGEDVVELTLALGGEGKRHGGAGTLVARGPTFNGSFRPGRAYSLRGRGAAGRLPPPSRTTWRGRVSSLSSQFQRPRRRCGLFCPNCGAQNPDNATACSNCGFNLKPATAAPKFKGTMLMMNSPFAGGAPSVPGEPGAPGVPGAPLPSSPPPGVDPNDPNGGRRQMKGTIVGIAPPAPGAAPAPQGLAPPTSDPGAMASGGSFAPPGGAGAVNPMGSTFVADDRPVPGFPPPSPGFGGGAPFGSAPAQPP